MAGLPDQTKAEIVRRLAHYEMPSEIHADLKARGVSITLQGVCFYDPSTVAGKEMSQKWRDLFHEARARYNSDLSDVAIAQKSYRLRGLERMARAAEKMKNLSLAAQLYEQAAKEVGGAYLGKGAAGVADVDLSSWTEPEFLERIVAGEDAHRVAADRARWLASKARES